MNNYRQDNRSGGRRFGGGGGYRGRDSGPREMFDAVCDQCGKKCKVPFRPSGGKPIYCSDCFESKGGARGSDRGRGRPDGRSSDNSSRQIIEKLDLLNSKLDKIIKTIGMQEDVKAAGKKAEAEEKVVVKEAKVKEEKKEEETVFEAEVQEERKDDDVKTVPAETAKTSESTAKKEPKKK